MNVIKIWSRLSNVSWLVQNCKNGPLRYVVCMAILKLRHRVRGGGILVTDAESLYLSILADTGCEPKRTIEYYQHELRQWRALGDHWERKKKEKSPEENSKWDRRVANFGPYIMLYALVRELKPKVIVETGTAAGSGTALLLAAAFKNGNGRVISLDIPPKDGVLTMGSTVERKDIGYLIPEFLRQAWHYQEGDAKVTLPRILAEQDVGMFIHDSLHTRTHMAFEYAVARALMRHKTLIASDDILSNNAFDAFLATHRLTGYVQINYPNTGFVANLFDDEERSVGTGIVTLD